VLKAGQDAVRHRAGKGQCGMRGEKARFEQETSKAVITLLMAVISSMANTQALAAPTSKLRSTSGLLMSPEGFQ
jgi:hypothetical protein